MRGRAKCYAVHTDRMVPDKAHAHMHRHGHDKQICILTRVSANTNASVHLRKIRTCSQTRTHNHRRTSNAHTQARTHASWLSQRYHKIDSRHSQMIPNTNQKHAQKALESKKSLGSCPTAKKNKVWRPGSTSSTPKGNKIEPPNDAKRRQDREFTPRTK